MELVEYAELPLRHRLLKDMNLFLLNKRTNVEVFFEFPGWHAWIFPLIAEVPRELPNRSEMQDEMFKYAVHVYSIIFTEVFVSKVRNAWSSHLISWPSPDLTTLGVSTDAAITSAKPFVDQRGPSDVASDSHCPAGNDGSVGWLVWLGHGHGELRPSNPRW